MMPVNVRPVYRTIRAHQPLQIFVNRPLFQFPMHSLPVEYFGYGIKKHVIKQRNGQRKSPT